MYRNIIMKQSYKETSEAVADFIYSVIQEKPDAAIILATGHSPLLGYRLLVKKILETSLDIHAVTWIKLDEWIGVDGEDEASCELFIQKELITPLQISEQNYIHFRLNVDCPEKDAANIEQQILALPGIHLAILGIGMNGHLGLNEPADELDCYAHAVDLDKKTKTHEMLTHTHRKVEKGITLGMKDLFLAEKILLIADGRDKELGLEYFLNDKITTKIPVSMLKLHSDCTCIINKECFPRINL